MQSFKESVKFTSGLVLGFFFLIVSVRKLYGRETDDKS